VSLRNAVLGLLNEQPMTGFDLVREFDVARSVVWPAPQNEVYRVLAALAAEALIREHSVGARGARTYAITDAGRVAHVAWLEAPSDYALRYDPLLKAVFLRETPPKLRRARARADLAFFQEQIAILETAEADKGAVARRQRRADGRRLTLALYRAAADWARAIADDRA
jgi:DNA-binding PadR family transcriptional regulator